MRELSKLFVTRYGSTRVEVAMEMKSCFRIFYFLFFCTNWIVSESDPPLHLQLLGSTPFVASYISDGGWGYGSDSRLLLLSSFEFDSSVVLSLLCL